MSRRLAPVSLVLAALLATTAACGSDGDEASDKPREIGPGIIGTVDKPESPAGCKTDIRVSRTNKPGEPPQAFQALYPAVVSNAAGTGLTLYVSDEKLDLGKLPESPRKDDNNLAVVNIIPQDESTAKPLVQGQRIAPTGKNSRFYLATAQVLGGDGDLTAEGDGAYNVTLIQLGAENEGVCVRVRYTDPEKSITGLLFAPLTKVPGAEPTPTATPEGETEGDAETDQGSEQE